MAAAAEGRSGFQPLSRCGAVIPQENEGLCGGRRAFRARKAAGSRFHVVVVAGGCGGEVMRWEAVRVRLALVLAGFLAGDAGVLPPSPFPLPPKRVERVLVFVEGGVGDAGSRVFERACVSCRT